MFIGSAPGEFLVCFVVYRSEQLWASWMEGGPTVTYYGRIRREAVCKILRTIFQLFSNFILQSVFLILFNISFSILLKKYLCP